MESEKEYTIQRDDQLDFLIQEEKIIEKEIDLDD